MSAPSLTIRTFFWVVAARHGDQRSDPLTPSALVSLVSTAATYLLSCLTEANRVATAAWESGPFSKSLSDVTVPAHDGERASSQRAAVPASGGRLGRRRSRVPSAGGGRGGGQAR